MAYEDGSRGLLPCTLRRQAAALLYISPAISPARPRRLMSPAHPELAETSSFPVDVPFPRGPRWPGPALFPSREIVAQL